MPSKKILDYFVVVFLKNFINVEENEQNLKIGINGKNFKF